MLKQLLLFIKENECGVAGGSIASWLRANCLPWIMGRRHRPDMMTPVLTLRNYFTARRCGDQCTERGLGGTHSLFFTLFQGFHLNHPFHSLLVHLLEASVFLQKGPADLSKCLGSSPNRQPRYITHPADPFLRTKSISKQMSLKDKRLGISRSRFETVIEIREDSIPDWRRYPTHAS